MHAWLKPVLSTPKYEIAYFCCMHILSPKIWGRGVTEIQEILNGKFYTLQNSDLSLNKYVNKGPSSRTICHFQFLLHCHCNMKQQWEERCPKVLLWEQLVFLNSCANSGSYQAAYARWPLPLSTSYWFQQYWTWDSHFAIRKCGLWKKSNSSFRKV